jgi:outer membrane protein insertion porin family
MTNPMKLTRGMFLALTMLTAVPVAGLVVPGVAQAATSQLVASVLFEGNQAFSDSQLLNLVNVGNQGTFTQGGIAADAENIRQAYLAKGFKNVSVTTKLEAADGGRTRIVFVVNEGQRVGIAAINFTGNNAIGAGTLKSIIRTHETGLLSWLFRDDSYSDDQLMVDKGLIELYYANHGYPDAQVTSAVGEFDSSRNAYFVNFTVNEGERYRFGEVSVESSIPGINTAALGSLIRTKKGESYNYSDLSRSQDDIAAEAASQGFSFADVRPRVDRDAANSTFNVTYLVDQGARLYVERINITGNEKTRDAVIRRELEFGEGDPFNRSMLQRGKSEIEGLGFFSAVNVDLAPGSASDKVVVNISVVEQSTGDYGVSAGYSSDQGLLGELSVTERNFLGRGQYVKASVSASESAKNVSLSFTEPRFMGLKVSSGFDVYYKTQSEDSSAFYGTTSIGGQVRLGLPVTRDVNLSTFVGYENKAIEDGDGNSLIVNDGDSFNKAWVGYSLSYNTLDNQKHPTEGITATFTQQYIGLSYSNLSGDSEFDNLLKTEAKARYYMPLLADYNVIGSIKGQAGVITSLDGGDVHPLEAFRGGSSLVRGFINGGMGAKASSGESLGYTAYVAGSAEIEFPMPILPESYGVRGSVWADAALIDGIGNVTPSLSATADSIDENFKSSVGASIIWDSPFGPLRGDFAYVLNKATDDSTQVFALTIQNLL